MTAPKDLVDRLHVLLASNSIRVEKIVVENVLNSENYEGQGDEFERDIPKMKHEINIAVDTLNQQEVPFDEETVVEMVIGKKGEAGIGKIIIDQVKVMYATLHQPLQRANAALLPAIPLAHQAAQHPHPGRLPPPPPAPQPPAPGLQADPSAGQQQGGGAGNVGRAQRGQLRFGNARGVLRPGDRAAAGPGLGAGAVGGLQGRPPARRRCIWSHRLLRPIFVGRQGRGHAGRGRGAAARHARRRAERQHRLRAASRGDQGAQGGNNADQSDFSDSFSDAHSDSEGSGGSEYAPDGSDTEDETEDEGEDEEPLSPNQQQGPPPQRAARANYAPGDLNFRLLSIRNISQQEQAALQAAGGGGGGGRGRGRGRGQGRGNQPPAYNAQGPQGHVAPPYQHVAPPVFQPQLGPHPQLQPLGRVPQPQLPPAVHAPPPLPANLGNQAQANVAAAAHHQGHGGPLVMAEIGVRTSAALELWGLVEEAPVAGQFDDAAPEPAVNPQGEREGAAEVPGEEKTQEDEAMPQADQEEGMAARREKDYQTPDSKRARDPDTSGGRSQPSSAPAARRKAPTEVSPGSTPGSDLRLPQLKQELMDVYNVPVPHDLMVEHAGVFYNTMVGRYRLKIMGLLGIRCSTVDLTGLPLALLGEGRLIKCRVMPVTGGLLRALGYHHKLVVEVDPAVLLGYLMDPLSANFAFAQGALLRELCEDLLASVVHRKIALQPLPYGPDGRTLPSALAAFEIVLSGLQPKAVGPTIALTAHHRLHLETGAVISGEALTETEMGRVAGVYLGSYTVDDVVALATSPALPLSEEWKRAQPKTRGTLQAFSTTVVIASSDKVGAYRNKNSVNVAGTVDELSTALDLATNNLLPNAIIIPSALFADPQVECWLAGCTSCQQLGSHRLMSEADLKMALACIAGKVRLGDGSALGQILVRLYNTVFYRVIFDDARHLLAATQAEWLGARLIEAPRRLLLTQKPKAKRPGQVLALGSIIGLTTHSEGDAVDCAAMCFRGPLANPPAPANQ